MTMTMPNAMEQPIPPSVREILTAYTTKGTEADREVLLAILQAKAAEDQRITALATLNQQYVALQRHALEATALAVRQQQQQQEHQNNCRPSSSASRPQSSAPPPPQQQQQRHRTAGSDGNTAFPLSPYSNTSSARSPSPPTPHLTAVPVPTPTAPPALKRKYEETFDADVEGAASSSSAARQPPHSHRRARTSPSLPHQQPLSPNSLRSPRVPPAHGGSHSRTSSQSSSSHTQAQPSSAAPVTTEYPSSVSPSSSGSGSAKHSPAYRRLDINSMLSNGPPISALRGGGDEPVDEL